MARKTRTLKIGPRDRNVLRIGISEPKRNFRKRLNGRVLGTPYYKGEDIYPSADQAPNFRLEIVRLIDSGFRDHRPQLRKEGCHLALTIESVDADGQPQAAHLTTVEIFPSALGRTPSLYFGGHTLKRRKYWDGKESLLRNADDVLDTIFVFLESMTPTQMERWVYQGTGRR